MSASKRSGYGRWPTSFEHLGQGRNNVRRQRRDPGNRVEVIDTGKYRVSRAPA